MYELRGLVRTTVTYGMYYKLNQPISRKILKDQVPLSFELSLWDLFSSTIEAGGPEACLRYIAGAYIWFKKDIYSSCLENDAFPPLATRRFLLLSCSIYLNSFLFCTYLPFYFLFSLFLSPFSLSFPFLPFCIAFSSFFSSPFHIFPPNDIACYSPTPEGRGIFQYIDPWHIVSHLFIEYSKRRKREGGELGRAGIKQSRNQA